MSEYGIVEIADKLKESWGKFSIYHIYNVGQCDYESVYEELAMSLGEIKICHPVNNRETKISKSRDIRYTAGVNHYYASNIRQPLHNDYAYYEQSQSPDWLMLYCLEPSDYGGDTNILTINTLREIMEKYKPDLLAKLNRQICWIFDGLEGKKIHRKIIFDGKTINWNYSQIKKELNNKEDMLIVEEFFSFLESFISNGFIYDFSKSWNKGDCIIFNDSLNLHSRNAFLGDRWLKDHAFFNKEKK